ncbi:hypothetical protein KZZ52_42495 [Dactylosporangium sp. AC04546]|uniref:hypothetical protein n=1 Tax=Dactylosporangium sp. AC04546 TaxID=2862460 RepID=UPI001EE03BB8|nr:hypothetical protein [Dactylosporangium sp. AC04546]WVK80585.1 hypothetical protein KZZ52_42495 [Dactylosporangium sp. AC04546]
MRVLGLEIPDAGPVFVGVLTVHVMAGLTGVGSATLACLARKRPGRHPWWGRVYLWALGTVSVSAVVMAVIRWPADVHLAAIALVACGLAGFGWWARRRHRPGWPVRHAIGLGGSFAALLTGFYVDNGPQLPVWNRLPHAAYWLLPSGVAAVLIWRALRRYAAGVNGPQRAAASPAARPAPPR